MDISIKSNSEISETLDKTIIVLSWSSNCNQKYVD